MARLGRAGAKRRWVRDGLLVLVMLSVLSAPVAAQGEASADQGPRVDHLAAFARLYGYVRFFVPSDEASEVDWERFAIHGARQVEKTRTPEELYGTLRALFAPIAPSLRIYPEGGTSPGWELASPTDDKVLVAWQHQGVGLNDQSTYKSSRLNRPADRLALSNSAARYIDGEDYKGSRFRLSAQMRARSEGGFGGGRLFIQALNERYEVYLDEDQRDRLLTSSAWQRVELSGTFSETTSFITYGTSLAGLGEACFDEVRLEVEAADGEWRSLEVENGDFEDVEGGIPRKWDFGGYGYSFTAVAEQSFSGRWSGCIRSSEDLLAWSLFAALPSPEEELDKPLGASLRVRFPIALWLDSEAAEIDSKDFVDLQGLLSAIDVSSLGADELAVRIAGVTIFWNVLQHFYPYFDVVSTDWAEVLTSTLAAAIADRTPRDFRATLRQMVARLEDGHGRVFHPELRDSLLNLELGWIEDQLVVLDPRLAEGLERGDVIESIDGVEAQEALQARAAVFSGSPQWRRLRALWGLAPGVDGSLVTLAVRRDDGRFIVEVPRSLPSPSKESAEAAIREVAGGIWYVDLSRASMESFAAVVSELAEAKGVVFDLRGYPNSNHDVLRHLTDTPIRSAKWNVPQYIYPDQEKVAGYRTTGRWTLDPKEPRFSGRSVFLTGAAAISYAESVLGIVEHYRLAEIVGERTAGTNGNINRMRLPGGYHVVWTGMRVIKHDDSQHHLVGILPTVPVSATLRGVREGRDEVLERAVELLTN